MLPGKGMAASIDLARLQRLLIVKLSSIGDVVHALPVAVALRRRYPHLQITWVAEDWTAALLHGHPAIDRVVTFPAMRWTNVGPGWVRSFRQAVHSLRSQPYDLSVDLQGLLKSASVALLSGAPRRIGVHPQREGAHFVSRAVPPHGARLHVVEDYLRCAEFLGAASTPVSFALPIQPDAEAAIARKLSDSRVPHHTPLIVINPSASAAWKTWPLQQWVRVADAMGRSGIVVLVGGAAQTGRHAELARRLAPPMHDFTGRTTLAELVALLDRCALHIAPDTGSAHIAAALGRPVVSVFGPTPTWRKAPYGNQASTVSGDGQCGVGCPRFCLRGRSCLPVAVEGLIAQAERALARAQPAPSRRVGS
jgi:lipopolysaccharide heptosyltransferase I